MSKAASLRFWKELSFIFAYRRKDEGKYVLHATYVWTRLRPYEGRCSIMEASISVVRRKAP